MTIATGNVRSLERSGRAERRIMPSSSDGERKYRAIASDLRAAIQSGDYPPGSRLPGENDIMRDYKVARMTARQALAQLINEGLVTARKGAGVYVSDFRPAVDEPFSMIKDRL